MPDPFPSVEVPASDAPGRYLVRDGCDPERIARVWTHPVSGEVSAYDPDGWWLAETASTFPVLPPEHCTRCGCPDNHHTEDHCGRTYCHCLQCPGHTSTGPA